MELFRYLIYPLILTILIECFVLSLLRIKKWYIYALCIGMNLFTNVSLNCFGYYVKIENIWLNYGIIILLEGIVWFIEGIGYYFVLRNKKQAIHYSLVLNLSSFVTGIILQIIIETVMR